MGVLPFIALLREETEMYAAGLTTEPEVIVRSRKGQCYARLRNIRFILVKGEAAIPEAAGRKRPGPWKPGMT